MEDEVRVSCSESLKPSYWLDACEDISCDDYIHGFVADLGSSNTTSTAVVPSTHSLSPASSYHQEDVNLDPCFFGGIDQILDSIKNGDGLPADPGSVTIQNDNVISAADIALPDGLPEDNSGNRNYNDQRVAAVVIENNNNKNNINNKNSCNVRKNFFWCEGDGDGDCHDAEERYGGSGKRARLGHHNERRGLERPLLRKRTRGWDDMDSCRRDRLRRKELRKDMDRREARGYWERDKEMNEMVFHLGSWEVDRNREGRMPTEKSCQSSGVIEKKPEQPSGKYKLPEEQARQYQLDVLEQAKKKNTIAFLETGAGKTLIAVLLIKSVCCELQRKNKRLLAVFLVPKVPLVYQQAEVIRDGTGYEVGHYCGEMGQDFWDARRWQREFETKQRKR